MQYIREIFQRMEQQVKILQYADDIAVYAVGERREDISNKVASAMEQIDKNLREIGLEIEPEKTQVIDFYNSDKNKKERKVKLKVNDKEIESQEQAKFLGIVFDQDLRFDKQVDNVQKRAGKTIGVLSYLNKVWWGMELNSALYVYNSYVRSILDYGLFVYYPREWKYRDKMEKILNKGIRIALGYRNSTPINVMLMEANSLRLEERAGYLARNHWTKVIVK